jgi:tetratricopeptide (TPR) repeat protein
MTGVDQSGGTGPRDASATRTTGTGAAASGAPAFEAGELLAERFRVIRFIARGGMGEVYEARDLELGEDVALKTIRRDVAGDARALERFKTEIHLARKVTHPNACRIFDVFHHRPPGAGAEAETLLLSMELLRGETLSERLRREGRLGPAQALALATQMVAALEAAHRAGVIHRDFKSGNVILASDPHAPHGTRAVVTDFGLARPAPLDEASPLHTQTESLVVGTPAYMAPEQVEGGPLTPRSDIYALGVVLYEMLTGERPFAADTPLAGMVKRLKEPPRSPRALVRDLDARWEAVILRCLERDPGDRFASAHDVGHALAGGRVAARGGGRARVRRRLLLAAAAAACVALIVAWALASRARQAAAPAQPSAAELLPADVKPRRAVAVLGFRNLSGRDDTAWLSTALAEMLGSELAAGEALRIVTGEAVARMKLELALQEVDALASDTLARVRRHLGADLLVMGSYAQLGGRIRLDLRLQDARAGETIASLSESGVEAELFELVSRMGARLRTALGASPLSAQQAGDARAWLPSGTEAARLYSEGLARLRLGDALGARPLLERAAALEPRHPLIHASLAAAWSALGYEGKAEQSARQAFELAGVLSREERLAVEGRYRESAREWDQAIEIYRSLLRFFPDNLDYALRLASVLTAGGNGKQATAVFEQLRRLPPPANEDPRIDLAEALCARQLSDNRRSLEAARRAVAKAEALGARRLLARAYFDEGSALQNLGELDPAQAALERARRMYAEAGDRNGLAGSLNNLSLITANRGDLRETRRLVQEALALYSAIGKKSGEALMQGNLGNVHYFEGDFAGARRMWERTLATYREINEKDGIARMLTNIASVTAEQGDPAGALASFEQALAVWREVGQRNGEATTLHDMGKARFQLGDLAGARAAYRDGLAILREIGDKSYLSSALHDQGELLRSTGDTDGARGAYQEALRLREGMGEKGNAALTRLALAELELDQGRAAEAEQAARAAAAQFSTEQNADAEVEARLVLSRALQLQGRGPQAREEAAQAAQRAERGQNRGLRTAAAIGELRLAAAAGERTTEPLRRLRALIAEKGKTTPFDLRLEARLAEAEAAASGDAGAAAAQLRTLEAEARAKGFAWIADQAAASGARLATRGAGSLR